MINLNYLALILIAALIVSSCSIDDSDASLYDSNDSSFIISAREPDKGSADKGSEQVIGSLKQSKPKAVAFIGKQVISLKELDATIQLALFDLEWRKYQLRKQALNALLKHKQQFDSETKQAPEIALLPPSPPRILLANDGRAVKGSKHAAINLAIFCSFQSSHCARLQPELKTLETSYPEQLSFRFFDFPQKFHRYGISAANAARCAQRYAKTEADSWAFQSSLYADINQLNHDRYIDIAEQLGIKSKNFDDCLAQSSFNSEINADIKLGKQLGLGNVPVVFINGLYVKGANAAEMYSFYINQEFVRLGLSGKKVKPQASLLPLTLIATSVSNNVALSSAMVTNKNNQQVTNYQIGQQLMTNVTIIAIKEDRILIDNQGTSEVIKIQSSQGYSMASSNQHLSAGRTNIEQSRMNDEEAPEDRKTKPRTLPASGVMTLSREWLSGQLARQEELKQYFHQAEHVVEGSHLLKLKDVDNQRFYTTLGLKSGDVIMRVNDQWVHEGQNPLWASLEGEKPVSLVLMRQGLPYRYDYNIK